MSRNAHTKKPRRAGLLFSDDAQRPKNSQSKMMTGIGTPSSHNNNPRPILSSIQVCIDQCDNVDGAHWFRRGND